MIDEQADAYLPNTLMRSIGALRTYAQRAQFFFAVPNTLVLIGVVLFDRWSVLQEIFGSRLAWIGFILFVVAPAVVLVDRVLLHPAQIIYNQHQNGHESRSPNYRETMENQRRISDVEEKVDRLLTVTDGGEGDG